MNVAAAKPSVAPWLLAGAFLVLLVLLMRRPSEAQAALPSSEPAKKPEGFSIAGDCSHLTVTDKAKFAAALQGIFDASPAGSAEALTRSFFDAYLPGTCRSSSSAAASARIDGAAGALPSGASVPQQAMFAMVYLAFLSLRVQKQLIDVSAAEADANKVASMTKAAGLTKATWDEVFGSTVPSAGFAKFLVG